MGRPFKMKPNTEAERDPGAVAKRKAASIRRKRGRGEKPRVVAGTALGRALGIM